MYRRALRDASFILAYSSTLKKETAYSSETLFDFQRTRCHYIPEDRLLY
jgi:hypothetical protein